MIYYVGLKTSTYSTVQINKFLYNNGLEVQSRDFHCTLMYSKSKIIDIENFNCDIYIEADVVGIKHLNNDCCTLLLKSDKLDALRGILMMHKGVHSYNPYTPHITIAKTSNTAKTKFFNVPSTIYFYKIYSLIKNT